MRRVIQVCLTIALLIIVFIGYTGLKNFNRRMRDLDRTSVCIGDLIYIGQQLHDYATLLPQDATIEAAVGKLVQLGHMDSSRLQCGCSGEPYMFRGDVTDLHRARERGDKEIVAFDPLASHHPSVALVVLYADGQTELVKHAELKDLLGRMAASDGPHVAKSRPAAGECHAGSTKP